VSEEGFRRKEMIISNILSKQIWIKVILISLTVVVINFIYSTIQGTEKALFDVLSSYPILLVVLVTFILLLELVIEKFFLKNKDS